MAAVCLGGLPPATASHRRALRASPCVNGFRRALPTPQMHKYVQGCVMARSSAAPPPGEQLATPAPARATPPALAAPARAVLPRRSLVDDGSPVPPLAMVVMGAYVLGTASSMAGTPAPSWAAAAAGAALGGVFAALHRYGSARLWRPPHGSLNVVITGGTRGLGKALAREFLTHADSVLITGRSAADAAAAAAQLAEELVGLGHPRPRLGGAPAGGTGPALHVMACDVTSPEDVAAVGKAAVALLGSVDVWVCNAGTAGSFKSFLGADDDTLGAVVRTNLLGALLCAREAGRCMLHQPLGGHIFLMDGAGADGGPTPQYAAYGATKAALPQLASTLRAELARTAIGVHMLSPGMMLTELLLEGATAGNKAAFNILCEQPETVAAFLVPRVRSAVSCGLNGTYTRYLTPAGALGRLLTAPMRIGRFFDASGQPVYAPERERILGKGAKATARRQAAARLRSSSLSVAYSLSLAVSVVALCLDTHASAFPGH